MSCTATLIACALVTCWFQNKTSFVSPTLQLQTQWHILVCSKLGAPDIWPPTLVCEWENTAQACFSLVNALNKFNMSYLRSWEGTSFLVKRNSQKSHWQFWVMLSPPLPGILSRIKAECQFGLEDNMLYIPFLFQNLAGETRPACVSSSITTGHINGDRLTREYDAAYQISKERSREVKEATQSCTITA